MRPRPSLFVAIASALLGLVLGLMLGRPSKAQPPVPAGQVGRYQVSVGGELPYAVVVDTVTGRCWSHQAGGGPWIELGAPPTARK